MNMALCLESRAAINLTKLMIPDELSIDPNEMI